MQTDGFGRWRLLVVDIYGGDLALEFCSDNSCGGDSGCGDSGRGGSCGDNSSGCDFCAVDATAGGGVAPVGLPASGGGGFIRAGGIGGGGATIYAGSGSTRGPDNVFGGMNGFGFSHGEDDADMAKLVESENELAGQSDTLLGEYSRTDDYSKAPRI